MMAKLPEGFSVPAIPIQAALSEGRTEDAKHLLVKILLAGAADKVVQKLAAEMLKPKQNRQRGRQKALTRHWFEIGEQFRCLRGDGLKYEEALQKTADKFGYSETHVRKAVAEYDAAREANDEATREYYETGK